MVPELPDPEIGLPFPSETTTLLICTGIAVVEGLDANWNVATATLPAAIVVEFMPHTRQVVPEQETDLFALVSELPTATLTPVISEV